MKKMCTTIEQSKKLKELGIDTDTADMCYKCIVEDPYDLIVRPYSDWKEEYKVLLRSGDAKVYPAWSLSALLELIPKFSLEKDVSNNEGYQLHYNYDTTYYDNPVDAAFEMVVWLKENGKI